jgi:hypothetical protein
MNMNKKFSFLRKTASILFITALLIVSGCKREPKMYRLIDHLEKENVVMSPLIKFEQMFERIEQEWQQKQMFPFRANQKDYLAVYDPPPPHLDEVELFDLTGDPGEKKNIADSNRPVSQELLARIIKYLEALERGERKDKKSIIDKELQERLKALGYIR